MDGRKGTNKSNIRNTVKGKKYETEEGSKGKRKVRGEGKRNDRRRRGTRRRWKEEGSNRVKHD